MPEPTIIRGNVHVGEQLSCATFSPPAGCITNAAIVAAAAIDASKQEHRWIIPYYQVDGTDVVAATALVHIVRGATCELVAFEAAVATAADGVGVDPYYTTVNLRRSTGGGEFATVLDAVITLNNAAGATTAVGATIITADGVDGDIYEIVVAVAGSTGNQAQGLVVTLALNEDA